MKRFLAITMIVLVLAGYGLPVYATIIEGKITKLMPWVQSIGADGVATLPAIFRGTFTGSKTATKWIALGLPGSTLTKIAGCVLAVAGAMAADYVFGKAKAWFDQEKINRQMELEETRNLPVGTSYSNYFDGVNKMGLSDSQSGAAAACEAGRAARGGYACGVAGADWNGVAGLSWDAASVGCYSFVPYTNLNSRNGYFFKLPAVPSYVATVQIPQSADNIKAKLDASAAAGGTAAALAAVVNQAALEAVANSLDLPDHPINRATDMRAQIAAALLSGVTEGQKATAEAEAVENTEIALPVDESLKGDVLTAAQVEAALQSALAARGLSAAEIAAAITAVLPPGVQGQPLTQAETQAAIAAALAAAGLSGLQIKEAVKEAVNDETGVDAPVEDIIVLPTKLSLTTILSSFMTSVNSLPMLTTLRGLTINVTGNSQLCLNLPAGLGGAKCFDGSRIADSLNMFGTVLLSLTTLFSFVGIFRGN